MTENEFQRQVIALARAHGWKCQHSYTSRKKGVYLTAASVGFPDLVLVHPGRGLILFRELKAKGKKPSAKQVMWLGWLADAGADVAVWWPEQMPEIERLLTG